MKIVELKVRNFRGVQSCDLYLGGHTVLVGDNNTGKSTLLEAIDLVLGPERLSRRPIVDEHDFFCGRYLDEKGGPVEIEVSLTITELTDDQQSRFLGHVEFWNEETNSLLVGPPPEGTDPESVKPALRVAFKGWYDQEEDDFTGQTYFVFPPPDSGTHDLFRPSDKRECGFLFLRTLRTGSRALSLERGSLLDVILKLEEKRLKMWEEVLTGLRKLPVAENHELGIHELLSSLQDSIRAFVPTEWSSSPHIRVSDLTRESLRKTLTVFMGTGAEPGNGIEYAAPYQHQGTGTINTLVLALISKIAELKQNVIFAMEEPEIAIPPHTQKQIVNSVRSMSSQSLFTSHSPFVLEEFHPDEVVVLTRKGGQLNGVRAGFPPTVKPKQYRSELRTRFCEALLARRILITEGKTEYDAWSAAARKLGELHPGEYKSLDNLGIAPVDAKTDSQVEPLGLYFSKLGKQVFAVFDKQDPAQLRKIKAAIPHSFEAPEKGMEDLVIKGTDEGALRRHALALVQSGDWPTSLVSKAPQDTMPIAEIRSSLSSYLRGMKGEGAVADLLFECSREEMPTFITATIKSITSITENQGKVQPKSQSEATARTVAPPPTLGEGE